MYKCPQCNTPLNESNFCVKCCQKYLVVKNENTIPKTSKQLADEHWGYIVGLLEAHEEDNKLIDQIGFHYKSAFIHGYKHAMEEK